MKSLRTLLWLGGMILATFAQAQGWQWGYQPRGEGNATFGEIEIDAQGDLWVGGLFSDTFAWGTDSLVKPSGFNFQVFIGKLSRNGTPDWVFSLPPQNLNRGALLDNDPNGGAWFGIEYRDSLPINDSMRFLGDGFALVKIDDGGTPILGRKLTPSFINTFGVADLRVQPDGTAIISGNFRDSLLIVDTMLYENEPLEAGFVASFAADGQLKWVQLFAKSALPVAVDQNNVYVSLYTNHVAKLDANQGNLIWQRPMSRVPARMTIGQEGTLYIEGLYADTLVVVDDTLTTDKTTAYYLGAMDSNGQVLWLTQPEVYIDDSTEFLPNYHLRNMVPAPDSGFWVAGFWRDSITFDGRKLVAQGGEDAMLLRFTPGGHIDSVITLGSAAHPYPIFALDVTLDSNYLYLGGNFNTSEQIGPDLIRARDTVGYAFDLLLAQFGSCPSATPTWPQDTQFLCPGDSVPLLVELSNPAFDYSITWQQNGQDLLASDSSVWVATQDGVYRPIVRELVCENDADTLPDATVEVVDMPLLPSIQLTIFDSLLSLTAGDQYLWYRNDTLLPYSGASIPLTAEGTYQVAVVRQGCVSVLSLGYLYLIDNLPASPQAPDWRIAPNPAHSAWRVMLPERHQGGTLHLYDAQGRELWRQGIRPDQTDQPGLSDLPSGLYLLQWTNPQRRATLPLLVR